MTYIRAWGKLSFFVHIAGGDARVLTFYLFILHFTLDNRRKRLLYRRSNSTLDRPTAAKVNFPVHQETRYVR